MMFVNTIYIVCKTLMLYSSSWILQKNLINLMEKEKYMGMDPEKFPSMAKAVYFLLGIENVLKTVIHTTKGKFMNATKDLWENRLLSMEPYFWLLLLCIYLVNYEYIQKRSTFASGRRNELTNASIRQKITKRKMILA